MVVDVGMNRGYFSLIVARMGYKVLAVEVMPSCATLAREALRLNNLTQNVNIVEAGLSRIAGGTVNSGGPCNDGFSTVGRSSQSIKGVELVTLMSILEHHQQEVAVMKMDIEGWEWFFFQQLAARATADFQPRILQITFELHLRILGTYPEIQMGSVDMANLVALLLRLGYRFITWVPNAAFLGIDVAELTLVLDS